ncbi:hypothetical protein [Limisphaera sp. 4302-co]|uniref:hypothetical protein n=1 Tax=Limisphaera sp. 4302-co TaxID=3400417 RepID=UPI003C200C04
MPIRLNLLAEAQALEEERRRDPVKRAVLIAVAVVACSLLGSLIFYSRVLLQNSELAGLQTEWQLLRKDYEHAREQEKRLNEVRQRLTALHRLATNRFLQGNLLQALQKAALPDVPLSRLKVEQFYVLTPATPGKTNAAGRITQAPKPPTATERIIITLDARDEGANPGDLVTRYKERIAHEPWFQQLIGTKGEVALRNLSPPVEDPRTGRAFVAFTLECRLEEKTR